jgi:Zn-dependent protease
MKQNPFSIDRSEAEQILISVVAIAFAFALALSGPSAILSYPKQFIILTVISVVTLGTGFILHEMAHKIMAIHYGAYARFQMWIQGLFIMVLFAFMGVLFAAPGAVYIYANKISKKENGVISLAGPATNVLISFVFLLLALVAPLRMVFPFDPEPLNIWEFGAQINLILAIFNMLPMFPLDGSKVMFWSKGIWAGFTLFCFIFGLFTDLLGLGSILMYAILIAVSALLSGMLFKRG